jgi:hypothetical protein
MLGDGCGGLGAIGEPLEESDEAPEAGKADAVSTTSTYYGARRDIRRCMAPLCGGWWVKRVNFSNTRCSDGVNRSECYVFDIDASGLGPGDEAFGNVAGNAAAYLFRGSLEQSTQGSFTVGVLRAREAWQQAFSDTEASGTFYRVDPNRIRCITIPCPVAYREAKLNSAMSAKLTGFTGPFALKLGSELQGADSVLAAGTNKMVRGNRVLEATQFWLRVKPAATAIQRPRSR